MNIHPDDVLSFWRDAGPDRWFKRDDAFDAEFRARFESAHFAAASRALDAWMDSPNGTFALVILLDQFPRNAFRGTGHAFATDSLARFVSDRALAAGHDASFTPELRAFFYLPFEHSERIEDQHRSVALFRALGVAYYTDYAEKHLAVIETYGRFPHRNRALGRESTALELEYLASGGGF